MDKPAGQGNSQPVTRRQALQAGVGTGLGVTALAMTTPPLATSAAMGKRGGHAFVLNGTPLS